MHCSGAARKCVILIAKCMWVEATSLGKALPWSKAPGALSLWDDRSILLCRRACPDPKNQCHRVLFSGCRRAINCEYT